MEVPGRTLLPPPFFGKRIPERMKIFTPKVFIGENIVLITY